MSCENFIMPNRSFGRQLPPNPGPARRNSGPMRGSFPMARATAIHIGAGDALAQGAYKIDETDLCRQKRVVCILYQLRGGDAGVHYVRGAVKVPAVSIHDCGTTSSVGSYHRNVRSLYVEDGMALPKKFRVYDHIGPSVPDWFFERGDDDVLCGQRWYGYFLLPAGGMFFCCSTKGQSV